MRRQVKNSEILYAIDFTAPYTNDYETTEQKRRLHLEVDGLVVRRHRRLLERLAERGLQASKTSSAYTPTDSTAKQTRT